MAPYFRIPETKKELNKLMLLLIYKIISKLIPYTHHFMKPTISRKLIPTRSFRRNDCSLLRSHGDVNKIFGGYAKLCSRLGLFMKG